jgi:rfaE bifunctional protein kinase chain/domain
MSETEQAHLRNEFERIFGAMAKVRALVVGDVMIDAYYWGRVERISPEAPVPIVQITRREHRLGGAANVALNVKSLGATPIICSVIGHDEKGQLFADRMAKHGFSSEGVFRSTERMTTVKTRIISSGHHLLRVDEESTRPLSETEERGFLDRCLPLIRKGEIDVVIFEDYNKGVLTPEVIRAVSAKAKREGIPVSVDPKRDNFFAYTGVDLFKPNFKELYEGLNLDIEKGNREQLLSAVGVLESQLHNAITLVTLSEHGVVAKDASGHHFVSAHPREILDVSGAGDTVISVASVCLALQSDARTIAMLANLAGGLVCEKVGVVPIDREQLYREALNLCR